MKKIIGVLFIIAVLYPFSCTPQSGIQIGGDGCDTVFIESPEIDKQFSDLNDMINQLTEQNMTLTENNESLMSTLVLKNAEIATLTTQRDDLALLLQQCQDTPPDVVRDTVYVDKIIEVIPEPLIDTVTVTHCADSTKNTTWFHHGGISGYPHDITFSTKEYGMTRITFKDSLTNEIKVQKSYKLKRTKDFENARTTFEFIE
jgi:hypothetical protein